MKEKNNNNKYPHKPAEVNYYRDLYSGKYYIGIIYCLI